MRCSSNGEWLLRSDPGHRQRRTHLMVSSPGDPRAAVAGWTVPSAIARTTRRGGATATGNYLYLLVEVWMKDPSNVPNIEHMELPEPADPTSPPTEKRRMVHGVIIHVGSVEDHNTTRCHSFTFWNGMVDGTSLHFEDGGHGFVWGQAGDF